jgi:hypothetical protein
MKKTWIICALSALCLLSACHKDAPITSTFSSLAQSQSTFSSLTQTASQEGSSSTTVPSLSSSSSSSKPSTSGGASSSAASSASSASSQVQVAHYRIASVTSSSSSVSVYSVAYSNGLYRGTVVKTLSKSATYTDWEEVCLYYQAFKALPSNYVYYASSSTLLEAKSDAYATYGSAARLYTYYSRTNGYIPCFPTVNSTSNYIEADIALTSAYASSASWNRGAGRLIIIPLGCAQYGSDPVIFKTEDHYANFMEHYNYLGGWGPEFDGETGQTESPHGNTYTKPMTVTFTIA